MLPQLKARLDAAAAAGEEEGEEKVAATGGSAASPTTRQPSSSSPPTTFYYQYPPTLRLQPGPSERTVRRHHDAEYGHQQGELNYWMPLTDLQLTRTTLWVESHEGACDDHPLNVTYGEIACFHGSACRHHVPCNESEYTRVSLDFRVGVEGYFDPKWSMRGTKEDHGRRRVVVGGVE